MSHEVPSSPQVDYEPEPWLALSDQQLKAIPLLLQGKTDVDAAAEVGIDRKTLYRWRLYDENFADELKRARTEIYRSCVDRLCSLIHAAIDVMERQVKEKYAPTSHRAARSILSLSGVGRAAAAIVKPALGLNDQPTTPGQRYADAPDASRSPLNRSGASDDLCPGVKSGGADPKSPTMSRAGARAIAKAIDAMKMLGLNPSGMTPQDVVGVGIY